MLRRIQGDVDDKAGARQRRRRLQAQAAVQHPALLTDQMQAQARAIAAGCLAWAER